MQLWRRTQAGTTKHTTLNIYKVTKLFIYRFISKLLHSAHSPLTTCNKELGTVHKRLITSRIREGSVRQYPQQAALCDVTMLLLLSSYQ